MLIAVTGGIGSGKSAVTAFLRARGANVVSADEVNAEMLENPLYVEQLSELFPDCVVGGTVDRKKLAALVYRDAEKRKILNAVAHPAIMAEVTRRAKALNGVTAVEIPLLDQVVDRGDFDRIIAVTAPLEMRVARIIKRDGVDRSDAEAAIRAQASDAVYRSIATDTVENAEGRDELYRKMDGLLSEWGVLL